MTPAQRRAAERGTAAEREAAAAMLPTLPVAAQTWEQLRAEVPGLVAFVSDHGEAAVALAERIRIGGERRQEAIREGDGEALAAIEQRLLELSTEMAGLDHGARRLGLVRCLLTLRDTCGPCAVDVVVPDARLEVHVR